MMIQEIPFGADLMTFDQMVDELGRSAEAIQRLRDHPGVLRGRAGDAGDDELRSAIVDFASAWDAGLATVHSQVLSWTVMIRSIRTHYGSVEQSIKSLEHHVIVEVVH